MLHQTRPRMLALCVATVLLAFPTLYALGTSTPTVATATITIYPPNDGTATGAHIAVAYGTSDNVEVQFRTDTIGIHVVNVVSDNPEWVPVDTNFTFDDNYFPDVRFTPTSASGLSRATFSIFTDPPGPVVTYALTGTRVANVSLQPTRFTFSAITLPTRLRLNPVRNELYAQGWVGNDNDDLQGHRLIRLSLATRQQTAWLDLPVAINDYAITQDGRWLYAVTGLTLYKIDLNTFQVAGQFTPTNITPSNATLWRIGVFSNTLAYVSTNPYPASGGPVYQWNAQTNAWTTTTLCDSSNDRGARAHLRVSADYTTISSLCDPYASPATTVLYRLGGNLESWTSEIRWATAVSAHGDWAVSAYFGSKWDGDFLAMHQGKPVNTYIHATDRYSYGVVFHNRYDLAYGIVDNPYNPAIVEISPARAIETRRITLVPPRPLRYDEYLVFPSMDDPTLIKDNQLYTVLWYEYGGVFIGGEIVVAPLTPYDALAPSSQVLPLPPFSPATFSVFWSGSDNGPAGLCAYDIQVRDGAAGVWTDWITDTTQTTAVFTGTLGHTYSFRSRARDWMVNLEAYPGGDGDTSTYIYRYQAEGRILTNREQPIMMATVQANPAALNVARSDLNGKYGLYFDVGGTFSLSAGHARFGSLPTMQHVVASTTTIPLIFYLPPLDDVIANGGFETGDLSGWVRSGLAFPVITSTAHTGSSAASLKGSDSRLEQTITFSPTFPVSPTLSLLYYVATADPLSDTFSLSFVNNAATTTFTLPLTGTGWVHQWRELPARSVPTGTLRIKLASGDAIQPASIIVDEISLGSSVAGAFSIHLPIVRRD
jgi:hypothetical protein